ncbi:MAG: alpha-ketoacid dehydrogenase subunit beta, partial [Planctomycetes bacterium]|nr:alpha-ketoacid dehydrogenase subunit beta [Planctomycetota bacterium]
HYMFGGSMRVPLVIRLVVGRGWGQGPQHSQSLQATFAHVPGLKVVMPATPHDAKGLLAAAIEDDNPVIYIEHRWLHNTFGPVPRELYRVPLGTARIAREGRHVTVAATSFMILEALRAAETLSRHGVEAEVVDVRCLKPLDEGTILGSVRKTGRLIAADTGWRSCGFAAELVALAAEEAFDRLEAAPVRLCSPDHPAPTSPALCEDYYPRAADISSAAARMLGVKLPPEALEEERSAPHDVPDASFRGPF